MKKILNLFFILSLFVTFNSAHAAMAEKESDCDQILDAAKSGSIKQGDKDKGNDGKTDKGTDRQI